MPDLISVKNNGNRKRTVLVFASLAIAIMALVLYLGSLNVRQFEQTVVSDTQERLLTIARTQAEHIEEVICEIQCDLETLAANPIVKSRIRNKVRGSEIAEGDYRPFQHVFLEERHVVAALYRIDSTGTVQARMPSAEGREGRDYSTKPGVKFVLENHTKHREHIQESYGHVSELFTTGSGAYAISVCVPVFEKEEFIGVLRALIYADQLGVVVGGIKVGEQGYAWIIEDNGQVLSHPDAEQIGADFMAIRREVLPGADWSELEDVAARMRDGEEGVASYHSAWWTEPNPRMVKKLAAFAPVEVGNERWSVAVTMGYDEIAGPIARYTRNTLILGGLLILIFLAGGMALYRVQKKKDELEIIAASATELESANRELQTEITERKQVEEALNHFKSALESSLDAVGMSTPKGHHWYQNKAYDELFGDIGTDPPVSVFVNEEVGREVFATIMAGDEWTGEVEMRGKDGEILDSLLRAYAIKDKDGTVSGLVGLHTDITERKQAEQERDQLLYALGERIKELQCLYGTAKSIQGRATPEEVFQDVAALIPPGWQYPEITRGKVIFDGMEYVSEPFEETPWQQSSAIVVDGERRGAVEVYYLEERPERDEGPFLKEERDLIDGLAQALARMVERKQAEQKLGNSEASLAEAQRIAHLGNWDWDIEKDELLWSDEIYRIFGLQPQEFAATYEAFLSSIHPDDRDIVKETVAGALSGEESYSIDHRVVRPDGTERSVGEQARVFYSETGQPIRMVGTVHDITERKQAEEALQEAYKRNETILQTSMDGVMIMRPDGSIIECNEAFCEMAGYSQDELLDMNIGDLSAQMTAEEVGEVMQQVMQAGSHRFETAIRHKNGSLVDLEISATFVELRENSFLVSFARDITETRKLWDELNQQLVRDSLTGVYNRRYFNETVIQEIKRADRYGHHVSFIMGDIDGLKAVNDNCGHLVGDQILQGTAQVLEQASRAADVVIRYGGDEFLVVMPETGPDQARSARNRLEQAFNEWLDQRAKDGTLPPDLPADVGFSMGMACYQPDTDVAIEEVLAQADEAMYWVKQAKRAQRAPA